MKAITTLNDIHYSNGLTSVFSNLSKKMLKLYKKHGETQLCIDLIQKEALTLCYASLDTQQLMQNVSPRDVHAKEDNSRYVFRIVHTPSLKVVLHVAPAGTKFPAHFHLDTLNLLMVKKGALQVEQFSKEGSDHQEKQQTLLTKDKCSVGLQRYYNRHSLMTTDQVNVFFSIRCKVPKPRKLRLIYSLGVFLAPAYGCGFADFSQQRMSIAGMSSQHEEVVEIVQRANKIRMESNEDEEYMNAAELYLKAANKNNAEAQYWLSIMYLKGMGVEEDDDHAMHWVSVSSDQNYPPAKELLHHLLTYDEALDC